MKYWTDRTTEWNKFIDNDPKNETVCLKSGEIRNSILQGFCLS